MMWELFLTIAAICCFVGGGFILGFLLGVRVVEKSAAEHLKLQREQDDREIQRWKERRCP